MFVFFLIVSGCLYVSDTESAQDGTWHMKDTGILLSQ